MGRHKKRVGRVWTPEQRMALSAKIMQLQADKAAAVALGVMVDGPLEVEEGPVIVKERDPEVQAIIDTMPEERKAKLAMIQAKTLAHLRETKDGQEALERFEERKGNTRQVEVTIEVVEAPKISIPVPPRLVAREVPMSVPFRLTGSISGLMVSELGVCWCGETKLKWHPICLKVRV